ncbi:MAG: hypothetical protein FJZ01_23865 [Candidatus Sericytochromatia bacterium]|nr:hypothetical protein [Candidatus Tanganyikabacteria bacterium]
MLQLLAAAAVATAAAPALASPPEPEATAATIFAAFPGYGLGHFLAGDPEAGMRFLAMDLGATALWAVGPSVVALFEGPQMSAAPSQAANAVFAVGLVAHGGLKVWEVMSAREFALARPATASAAVPRADAGR